jgi:hypothetical protein
LEPGRRFSASIVQNSRNMLKAAHPVMYSIHVALAADRANALAASTCEAFSARRS